jgi:hypothetical protein
MDIPSAYANVVASCGRVGCVAVIGCGSTICRSGNEVQSHTGIVSASRDSHIVEMFGHKVLMRLEPLIR